MIEARSPTGWRDLQALVARILTECGLRVTVERRTLLARGEASIDVYAEDLESTPANIIACECKQWNASIPQSAVHAFRTVVAESGANTGLLICTSDFQKGTKKATSFTNVTLLTWLQFQELFERRWYNHCFRGLAFSDVDLAGYVEYPGRRARRKVESLSSHREADFRQLQRDYHAVASLIDWKKASALPIRTRLTQRYLPSDYRETFGCHYLVTDIPDPILDATALRPLAQSVNKRYRELLAGFEGIFGAA